jgi:imidazolonepropionase-like amidohydrolase
MVGKNIDLVRTGLANAQSTVKRLHDNGVAIVAGTDSPIFPYGLALVIELANYVDAGLTPAEALRTATANAAIALGAENEIGRVQPGLLADLVIVDGDPLTDVTDMLNVSGVMSNGRYRNLAELMTP